MKKIIIMALVMIGFYSAEAQRPACKAPDGKVCTKKGCYKTPYAHNFAVCKNDNGYYICCEEPNSTNNTFNGRVARQNTSNQKNTYDQYENSYAVEYDRNTGNNEVYDEMAVPQSQSYPRYSANVATSYEGYYAGKKRIKVCNNSTNVAEANKAAYAGCPTPAYDGPDKNKNRNMNVSNPAVAYPQPPNSGNRQ